MTIKSVKVLKKRKAEIDLTGPDGNAFVLLGRAKQLCQDLNKNYVDISKRMKSSDYENLIKVFDSEFGGYITLHR